MDGREQGACFAPAKSSLTHVRLIGILSCMRTTTPAVAFCPGSGGMPCRSGSQGGAAQLHDGRAVCGTCERRGRNGHTASQNQARSAAQQAASSAADSDAAPIPWEDRPIPLSEASSMLTVAGCGKQAHLAPLVEIRQGPEGTVYTTVAALGDSHSGALEVTDPFAVSDGERVAVVNGRFLQDAIKTHDKASLRGLTGADIRIDNGDVSVGETQVKGLDGLDEAGRAAAEDIASIERRARTYGVTKKAAREQAIADYVAHSGLGDKDAYVREFVKQGMLYPSSSDKRPDAYRAFHNDVHERMRNPDALVVIHDRNAEQLRAEYERTDMRVPRDEWLNERAQLGYVQDVELARSRFDNILHAEDIVAKAYRESVDEWGSVRDHDMAALRKLASPPPRYEGVTGRQDGDLMLAKECLAKCGDPTWEQRVTVDDFRSELDLITPATGTDHARPILTGLHFGDACGRRRMTATDSYRLMTSSVAVPQALAQDEHLVAADNLKAWAQHANKHLGKNQRTHLGIAVGEPSERYYGFHAGQMRVASRGSEAISHRLRR